MALQGKFIINNADFSPLTIYGVGTFLAFSGNQSYRNRGGCSAVPENGPLPSGKYWIVDRPSGTWKTKTYTAIKEFPTRFTETPTIHSEWFALYKDDIGIDDGTWINGVWRGNFRLHPIGPLGLSQGCITLQHHSDFQAIRNALLNTQKTVVPCMKSLMTYGSIEVISHDFSC